MNDEKSLSNLDPQHMVRCEVTEKLVPADETVEFRGRLVSAEGKEMLLRQMRNADGGFANGNQEVRPGFWRRFLCCVLDGIVMAVVVSVFAYMLMHFSTKWMVRSERWMREYWWFRVHFTIIVHVMGAAFSFFYCGIMHAKFGKTLGKMAGRFRVVNMDGTPVSARTAFVRAFWSHGIAFVTTILGLQMYSMTVIRGIGSSYNLINGIALIADRKYNRALHDRLAGTRVVMDSRNSNVT